MGAQAGVGLCFPQLLNASCRKPTLPWTEAVLLNSVLSLVSLMTVSLNLLVIISVSHFRRLHTPTNILLLSLAVSDCLVGLLLMPGEIFRKTSCWVLGDIMCSLYFYLTGNIVCASIGNIVLISAERYVAICDPLHYPTRVTVTRVKLCVFVCWLCAALYSCFCNKDVLIQPGRTKSCHGECVLVSDHVAGTVDLFLSFIFPVTFIIFLYLRVFLVAVSQARAMRSHVTAVSLQVSATTKKSELKAARTLGVLVVVYLMCFFPFYCYIFAVGSVINTSFASFMVFLYYFNSCLNPVIYALFYRWFRKAVKLILTLLILQPGSREANIL
ncbi:trace amine-associated receptor 13c-like [Parambassis ranga]|uniref:Trace amine-associated receptor 13c-like n=1 Tax=Parambassis ranga TaxID=210632 RepID=A0A6P7JER7_9TELE|nr:trace amine-associated receptor 13c-like [Parambassis ranga]